MRISDWSSDVCSSDLFEDADIEDAVAGAMIAKMRNMGEACTAANRFYVHSSVGEAFSTRLAERMAALKMGNGLDEEVAVGPLVNAEARDKVHALVLDARAKGAKSWPGGERLNGSGSFYPATVMMDVQPDAAPACTGTFGPRA